MSEPHHSKMLISREKSAYKLIDTHKTAKGQFFTTRAHWLTAPVREFIAAAAPACFLDPFAGEGHLLRVCRAEFSLLIHGLDLQSPHWPHNDSLCDIPPQPGALLCRRQLAPAHPAPTKPRPHPVTVQRQQPRGETAEKAGLLAGAGHFGGGAEG